MYVYVNGSAFTFSLMSPDVLQLLRSVFLCAKRCQRTKALPRLSPYLWMGHVLPTIPMHVFAARK